MEKVVKSKVVGGILSSLYPQDFTCNYCGKELTKPTRSGLCEECDSKLPYNNGNICECCGSPFDSETDYCLTCQNNKRYFEFARSPLIYKDSARRLIYDYKFKNKRYLAKYFVNLMVDTYLKYPYTSDMVCFVPISKKRMVERGYNQSELLAKEFANRLKLELSSALEKIKETDDQVGLSGKERAKNLEGAFVCNGNVKGKNILLIDDVLTTGSTVSECSKVLLKSGAKSVRVLVVASVDQKLYLA